MFRALSRVRHKSNFALLWSRRLPEGFGYRPWTIPVKNKQPVPLLPQFLVRTNQCFRGWPLQKRPRLPIHRPVHEVVRSRITNLQANTWVASRQFHQLWLSETSWLPGRLSLTGSAQQRQKTPTTKNTTISHL